MNHVFVTTHCPHCNRPGQFPLELLGKKTTCRHCHKTVTVRDADSSNAAQGDSMAWWLTFTDSGSRLQPESEKPQKRRPR